MSRWVRAHGTRRLLVVAGSLLAAELAATLALSWTRGEWSTVASRADERNLVAPTSVPAESTAAEEREVEVLHPYVGYVNDPAAGGGVGASGFFDSGPTPCAEESFVVELYGGSVANRLGRNSGNVLAEAVTASGLSGDRPVCIANFGLAGYKQPQQELLLAYRLALGERPDVVVNLDGFNEIALPVADNLRQGVNPWYPRLWSERVDGAPDVRAVRWSAERDLLHRRRVARATRFSTAPWRWSAAAHAVWWILDGPDRRREATLTTDLAALGSEGRSFKTHGPPFEGDAMAESVAVWERASLVMHRLCDGFGIRYLHAVQPNQYFPGTKPMGAVERRRAIHPYHPYGRAARRGYPLLVKGIERLNAAGVPVADLTRLFAEIEDALYLDNCCHLTADGERRLALAVADALADVSRRNDGAGTGP